jgi:hypothetical protein
MDSNDEGSGELCVERSDSSPVFEGIENDFNEIFRSLLRNISFMLPILPLSSSLVHTT